MTLKNTPRRSPSYVVSTSVSLNWTPPTTSVMTNWTATDGSLVALFEIVNVQEEGMHWGLFEAGVALQTGVGSLQPSSLPPFRLSVQLEDK